MEVTDNRNGTYALGFAPTRAGAFELAVSLEGGQCGPPQLAQRRRSFAGRCAPGAVAAAGCTLADEAQTALKAGETGRLRLRRADAFGNAVADGGAAPFAARGCGPGQLRASFCELPGGCAEAMYSATAAGEYLLTVHCAGEDSAPVPGTPLQIVVTPGRVSPQHCGAAFADAAAGELRPAGEKACVEFLLRDCYGNPSGDLAGQRVELCVAGPERHELCDAEGAGVLKVGLRGAGSYVFSARVGGQLLPGWPRVLHVQPAAADAGRCWLSGPALQARNQLGISAYLSCLRDKHLGGPLSMPPGSWDKARQVEGIASSYECTQLIY